MYFVVDRRISTMSEMTSSTMQSACPCPVDKVKAKIHLGPQYMLLSRRMSPRPTTQIDPALLGASVGRLERFLLRFESHDGFNAR